ncbi:MAG: hypothetical protein KDB27_17700, partial [Planctomycetales bacterium]|nr:hypothetical protein [Planctomycetales bacterium]
MNKAKPGTPVRKRVTNRRRLWLFRLIAVMVLPTIALVGLELIFRVISPGFPTSIIVPSESGEHLVDNYKFSWRYFPEALARSPQAIKTEAIKPNGRIRIVVFGGSAAMG